MPHNGAFTSTVRRRNGSQIGRPRTPRAHQLLLYAWSSRRTAGGNCLGAASGRCLRAARELLGGPFGT
eukprot:11156326-Lingulodinium_polyedra.AAC.1